MMTTNQPTPAIPDDEKKFSYSGDPLLEQAYEEAAKKGVVDSDVRVTDVDYGHGADIRITGRLPDGTQATLLDVRKSVHHALNPADDAGPVQKEIRKFSVKDIVQAKDSSGKITDGWQVVKDLGRDTYQLANAPDIRSRATIITATATELEEWMREYSEIEAAKPRVFKPGDNVNVLRGNGAMESTWYVVKGPSEERIYVVIREAEPKPLTKKVSEEELREWNK